MGNFRSVRSSLRVFKLFSCSVRALRMARVFLGLRSRGMYFLFLYSFLRFSFYFWCMTMHSPAGKLEMRKNLSKDFKGATRMALMRALK